MGQPLGRVFNIVNEYTRQPAENPVSRVLRDKTVVGLANHTVLVAHDGKEVPIDDSAAPIQSEYKNILGVVLVFRDVRLRREAEEARSRLAAIVEASEDAIIGRSLDGTVTSWNAGAERLYGYSAAEVRGQSLAALVPAERANELPTLIERVKKGERVSAYETVRRCKDGSTVDVAISVTPIRDAADRVVGAATIGRDITDRKRAEQALQQADQRKDEFLAMLAHELRNPLAPITNAVQVMKLRGVTDPQVEWSRAVVERQVRQLSRLVDDLLDVSRIREGKITLRIERLDLATIVNRAVETTRPLIEERRHSLQLLLPSAPICLEADPARLEQILANLLNNSAKYTEPGGHIWLSAEQIKEAIEIRVRDSGIGIAAEMLPRIFDMFVQAEHGVTRSSSGLGIGLSLVRRLVEMHGGSITAYSAGIGQGSEFVLRLPALKCAPEASAVGSSLSSAALTQSPRRLLVVDDNQDAAESLAAFLRLRQHGVEVAFDGPSALEAAERFRPEAIILDLGMPGMDGYEVARRLRREPTLKNTVLVALSGWGQENDRRRSLEAGFDFHLVKPVELKNLEALLACPTNQVHALQS
jgi:PAS domain S-box-containing protein